MPTYEYTTSAPRYSIGRPWTPAVRALILINVAVFLLQLVLARSPFVALAGLQVPEVFTRLRLWQPFTYLFLHGGFWHLLWNMFALWMFGCDVELALGTPRFVRYYLLTGVGAGWCVAVAGWLAGEQTLTIGASGAIFGLLMAYGILFAERTLTLLFFFILPIQMKAKTMVLIFGIFELLAGVSGTLGQVSHLAHVSGLLVGYLYFRAVAPQRARKFNFWKEIKFWWLSRRLKRIPRPEDSEQDVEGILEKISREGITSLTPNEREILAEAARRRQDRWPGSN